MTFKNFLLKSIPYVLSVFGGVAIYIISVYTITDASLNDLISNIAASLLAIPLIFLLYEFVNYKLSNNMNRQLEESLVFDVNSIVLKMIKVLRKMVGFNQALDWNEIEKMLNLKAKEIRAKGEITSQDIEWLKNNKKALNELAYKLARARVLPERQTQLVILITRAAAHIINEWEYKGNTVLVSKYIENLLNAIDDWFDSCDRESLQYHQQFKLTIDQETMGVE